MALLNHYKGIDRVQTHQKHTLAVTIAKNIVPKDEKQITKAMENVNKHQVNVKLKLIRRDKGGE